MITALIIYLVASALFIWYASNHKYSEVEAKIGNKGMIVLEVLFFVPIVLVGAWIENWDCESNKTKGHEFYDKLYK